MYLGIAFSPVCSVEMFDAGCLTFYIQKMGNILADFVHSFRPAAQMVTVSGK